MRTRTLLFISAALLGAGWVLPLFTIQKFVLLKNTYSVIDGIVDLIGRGNFLLAAIIATGGVVIPYLKLHVMWKLTAPGGDNPQRLRWLQLMHDYGRWSMLDVLIVAVLVVAAKLGVLVSVTLHAGIVVFAGAIISLAVATEKIAREYR